MVNYPMLWLVVFDDKEREFSIEGQSKDDISFTAQVAELQKMGAPIRCDTPHVATYPKKEDLINALRKMGLKYVEKSILDRYR